MNFEWAVRAMSKGAIVRRRAWEPGRQVRFAESWDDVRKVFPQAPKVAPANITFPFLFELCPLGDNTEVFTSDDDKADDWEIFEVD